MEDIYPTWEELMNGEQTPTDAVLVQAIAALSVERRYSNMNPDEVYLEIVQKTLRVAAS